MRHTVLSFTSRESYCDMILKSRPKFLRITFALVPPLISVLSGYSRPLLPPLPYSHPDYRFGQILVGERISDCLCFTKKKKNDGKPLTACFHSDGPQIKIMKTQTSIEKEKLGRGRNRNVRRERKKQEERNQYEPQDLETLWGNRPSFPASLTPSNPELWKSLYNPQVDSSYTYTLHLLCKYPAKKRNAQIIIMIEENRQNVEQFSFLS